MTENRDPAPAEQDQPQARESFLIECMKENLNQARHVENERMLFVSLFTVLVGGVLGVALPRGAGSATPALLLMLIFLNIICIFFVWRWNGVFKTHKDMAQSLCKEILKAEGCGNAPEQYYCFDYEEHIKGQRRKKQSPSSATYFKTGHVFLAYNIVVMVFLLILLAYSL